MTENQDLMAFILERSQNLMEQINKLDRMKSEVANLIRRSDRQNKFYQRLVNNSSHILGIIDNRGTVIFINETVTKYLGYEADTIRLHPLVHFVEQESKGTVTEIFAKVKKSQKEARTRRPVTLRHKNGSTVTAKLRCKPCAGMITDNDSYFFEIQLLPM